MGGLSGASSQSAGGKVAPERIVAVTSERRARHQETGEITLQQMLREWTMHDLGHIRQIAELVRPRKHLQAAGKLGDSYRLKP
jgi:hypothetical protein